MERKEIEKLVCGIKGKIREELDKEHVSDTLKLVSVCADILYKTNIYYADDVLEDTLQTISGKVLPGSNSEERDEGIVLFYDGFGLDNRGLAQIYLKALGKIKKLWYVTYDKKKDCIPGIRKILCDCGGEIFFLKEGEEIDQIRQLDEIVKVSGAAHFFYYSYPNDVVAPTLLFAYDGILKRYQINLTDHAFWLGSKCMDKCIEFREYGASISKDYRNIPQSKLVHLPFYPNIDRGQTFQGFPFEVKPEQRVIFSGGALYKTLGEGNKYYEIVDYLLSNHNQVIFWYAGSGDDREMKKLMERYPVRVFLTPERKDLFPLLKHCIFYLSTYPVCGGLMYQYAACAGKIPLTLRHGDINDGFLLRQKELGIEFDTLEELKKEIDRLMTDDAYLLAKSADVENCVITRERFEKALCGLLEYGRTGFPVDCSNIDTTAFRRIYLDTVEAGMLDDCFTRRSVWKVAARRYPVYFLRGVWRKILKKLK